MAALESPASSRRVRGCCPLDCQDTCSWVAHVEEGRVVRVEGAKEHPFTRGALCAKVNDYEQREAVILAWSSGVECSPNAHAVA